MNQTRREINGSDLENISQKTYRYPRRREKHSQLIFHCDNVYIRCRRGEHPSPWARPEKVHLARLHKAHANHSEAVRVRIERNNPYKMDDIAVKNKNKNLENDFHVTHRRRYSYSTRKYTGCL